MRSRRSTRISEKGFARLASWARDQKDSFNRRMELFMETLAEYGIIQANIFNNDPEFSDYIVFSREWRAGEVIFMAKKTADLRRYWQYGPPEGVDVDPLLMTEFGSGQHARSDSWTVVTGTGRGTFQPNRGHAFEDYWIFRPIEAGVPGELQISEGTEPTRPMYRAFLEMQKDFNHVAREVFGR